MTAPEPKQLTPERAAEIVAALQKGAAIVCYSKCWPCQFGQHDSAPHTWMDDEDREHAGIPADMPLHELAEKHPCGCRCIGGPK